jgi:serine/threonine protein kinase
MPTSSPTITLSEAVAVLKRATCPEDVFGNSSDTARETYELLASACDEVTKKELDRWWKLAELKIRRLVWGNRSDVPEVVIKAPKGDYKISARLEPGDFCDIYLGRQGRKRVVLKVPRHPRNNDLCLNESNIMRWFREESEEKDKPAMRYVTRMTDTFEMRQGGVVKRANAFEYHEGYFSLAEVCQQYPEGLDVRDAAWMWNRLLSALLVTHQAGLVHGAVLPAHFLICPAGTDHPNCHDGVLIDWSYAVKANGSAIVKAISPKYRDFYPPELLTKKPADLRMDIYMAARCMIALLGGTMPGDLPKTVPREVVGLLKTCLLSQRHRPESTYELYKEFGVVLTQLYGKRKYRPFNMPRTVEA